MPTVQNKRPYAVELAATGALVEAGGTVEVSEELADALSRQSDVWEVVDGPRRPTVTDVLADVGDDPNKARRALATEHESGKPRTSLVSRLEEIVAADEEKD